MPAKRNVARWVAIFVLIALCAGVPLSWVVVPLTMQGLNGKLCDSIAPDIQSVAEKPVKCDAGYIGISVITSEEDFETVCGKVQALIDGGRIGCSVRVETDTDTKYADLRRR